MKLQKLEIRNYRSCLTTKIDFVSNPSCLIGINGVGKSNILNSLLLFKNAIGVSRYAQRRYIRKLKTSFSQIIFELELRGKMIKVKCDFLCEADEKNKDIISYFDIKANFKEMSLRKEWTDIPIYLIEGDRFRSYYDDLKEERKSRIRRIKDYGAFYIRAQRIVEAVADISIFLSKISYYSASQFSDPSKCPVSFEIEDIRLNKQYSSHEKFIQDLYSTYTLNGKLYEKYISLVNESGIGLIDNITFAEFDIASSSYEVRSGGKIKKLDKNRKLIIPSVTIDHSSLSFNQLSEGTFKTLALIYYIITDNSPLLLIEEPEVCIHHGLLNSIISLIILEGRKKQIIISTHSDFVIDKLKPENIILVKKDPRRGTNAESLKKSMSANDYKAMKEYLLQSGNLGEYWKEGGFYNV